MHVYKVQTCDVLRWSDNDLDQWDAYHHDHNDDVQEGIVLNIQREQIPDEAYDDMPF